VTPTRRQKGEPVFLPRRKNCRRPAPQPTSWWDTLRQAVASFRIRGSRRLATTIASLLIVATLTFGAVGGTVYASQDSLPNQTLYAVKIFSEDMRLRFTNQPQEKLQLLETFTSRRVEELATLSEQGEELPQGTLSRLEQHTEAMLQLATEQEDAETSQSLHRIHAALQAHEEVISRLQEKERGKAVDALTRVQEKLQQKIQLAEQGLENPGAFREKMRGTDPFGNGPDNADSAGTPEGKGQPDDTGQPDDKGKPDDVGTPEDKGKPEDAGPPEDKGRLEELDLMNWKSFVNWITKHIGGPPEGKGKPDHAGGPPDGKGKPENPGKSEEKP